MTEPLELEFDRWTPCGMAVASAPDARGRAVLAWGVLPGERARVIPIRQRQSEIVCRAEQIIVSSPDRIPPREKHYLSCSPWQVMNDAAQAGAKRQILQSLFPSIPLSRFVAAEPVWGYRNKLEFSFTEWEGRLQLAFHERASSSRKVALGEGCLLGGEAMNGAALEVVEKLNERGIRAASLKSLVVRASAATNEALVALYVTDPDFSPLDLRLERSVGWSVFFSDPLSPASVATRVLARNGRQYFVERVAGIELECPLEGFFQNHAAIFSCAVEEIRRYVQDCGCLLELYSGVGAIGLALGDRAREIIAVESSEVSSSFAERNRRRIGAENYRPILARVECCAEQLLPEADVVVVDPPRSGLPAKLIDALAQTRPARIVYLSCNPEAQARDAGMLGPAYRPIALAGFDFYPQTPHVESLVILDRV